MNFILTMLCYQIPWMVSSVITSKQVDSQIGTETGFRISSLYSVYHRFMNISPEKTMSGCEDVSHSYQNTRTYALVYLIQTKPY